jgi:hypothetical protein
MGKFCYSSEMGGQKVLLYEQRVYQEIIIGITVKVVIKKYKRLEDKVGYSKD